MVSKNERTDLISVDEINQILHNYRIGKKPLANLLGWGETTVIRYIEGDLPTREYSDKLLFILHNPGYFYEILQQNKGRLTSVAYRKCNEAVKSLILESKIKVVAQYIMNKLEGRISLYELQMYLYYVQGFYLAFENQPLFEDDYMINEIDRPYESVTDDFVTQNLNFLDINKDTLSSKEKSFIDNIVTALSWYGPTMLSGMFGYERVLMKLSRNCENRKIISKKTITEYFTGVLTSNDISSSVQVQIYFHKIYNNLQEAEWNI